MVWVLVDLGGVGFWLGFCLGFGFGILILLVGVVCWVLFVVNVVCFVVFVILW